MTRNVAIPVYSIDDRTQYCLLAIKFYLKKLINLNIKLNYLNLVWNMLE